MLLLNLPSFSMYIYSAAPESSATAAEVFGGAETRLRCWIQ